MKAIDLFCGLGGWTSGLLAEGYDVTGYDIEAHEYGEEKYPARLVLQDVLTINGAQFKDAALIVASPPCQEFSYMAMPWTRAKQIARALRGRDEFPEGYTGSRTIAELTALFDACFRIQREACEAAGRKIPMVVENVRGAEPWVGRARWNFGSYYLWGDVPALMPHRIGLGHHKIESPHLFLRDPNKKWNAETGNGRKNPGFRFDGSGRSFQSESVTRHVNEGTKMGDTKMIDTMIKDGLWDAFNGYHMGNTAENVARQWQITREAQDRFAVASQNKAEAARRDGRFKDEIVPVTIAGKKGDVVVAADEHIREGTTYESVAKLKPAFEKDGTVTAANASGINDGAAAVLLMERAEATRRGLQPLGRLVGYAHAGLEPKIMGLGPVPATQNVLKKTGLKLAVMMDAGGKSDWRAGLLPQKQSVVSLVRVACYAHQISEAAEMIHHAHGLGYETSLNIMAISTVKDDCPGNVCPTSKKTEVDSARDRAKLMLPLAIGLGAAGVAAAGVGVYFVLAPPAKKAEGLRAVRLAGAPLGEGGAIFSLDSRF